MIISSPTPPYLLRKIFYNIIWFNPNNKVLLTFDDGPDPVTNEITLNVLNKFNIKAIFFLIGKKILNNHSVVLDIIKEGHFIANHSFSHNKFLIFKGKTFVHSELKKTDDLLNSYTNKINIFRPPYGYFSPGLIKIASSLKLKTMIWSLLSEDFLINYDRVIKNVQKKIKSNSIIVFHNKPELKSIIKDSLTQSISIIQDKGYEFERTFCF